MSSPPHITATPNAIALCTNCDQPSLTDLVLCEGVGHPDYDGHWFQVCATCKTFIWQKDESRAVPLSSTQSSVNTQASPTASQPTSSAGPSLEAPEPRVVCPGCRGCTLDKPVLCQGLGKDIRNYGRWYQICTNTICKRFVWHYDTPRAELVDIPEDVQIRHAKRKSMMPDGPTSSPRDPTATSDQDGVILCPTPNCLTSRNQQKRANKECTRDVPLCSSCCRALGGCRKHKLSPLESALRAVAISKDFSRTHHQSSAGSSGHGNGTQDLTSPPAIPATSLRQHRLAESNNPDRQFSRPLPESWAKPLALAHQQNHEAKLALETSRRLALERKRTVHGVWWYKAMVLPRRFTAVTPQLGLIVLTDNNIHIKFLDGTTFISVLCSAYPQVQWSQQEVSIPIPVEADTRLLLRSIDLVDADCLELDQELARFNAWQNDNRVESLALDITTMKRWPEPATSMKVPGSSSGPLAAAALRIPSISTLPSLQRPTFPLTYVVEMVEPMTAVRLAKGGIEIRSAFETAFPGIRCVLKTVYKHLLIFNHAVALNLLSDFVDKGLAAEGRWSRLVAEVQAYRRGPGHNIEGTPEPSTPIPVPTANSKSPADLAGENPWPTVLLRQASEAELSYDVLRGVKWEYYVLMDGVLNTFAEAKSIDIEIIIYGPPSAMGHRNIVNKVEYPSLKDGKSVYAALKRINTPGDWWKNWASKDLAVWHNGSRQADMHLAHEPFMNKVKETASVIYDFNVLESFLVSCGKMTWTAQPWIVGVPLAESILLNHDENAKVLLHDTFAAFSHYIYELNSGYLVHTDFQAMQTVDGVVIFDAVSHKNVDRLPGVLSFDDDDTETIQDQSLEWDLPGSDGKHGINRFVVTHVCNPVCRSLKLSQIFLPEIVDLI